MSCKTDLRFRSFENAHKPSQSTDAQRFQAGDPFYLAGKLWTGGASDMGLPGFERPLPSRSPRGSATRGYHSSAPQRPCRLLQMRGAGTLLTQGEENVPKTTSCDEVSKDNTKRKRNSRGFGTAKLTRTSTAPFLTALAIR